MPKTKQPASRSKKTPGTKKKEILPTLKALSAQVRGKETDEDDTDEYDYDEEDADRPATLVRTHVPVTYGKGLTAAQARMNLRDLFSAEETIIETITLNGRGKHVPVCTKPEKMKIFLRVRPFLPAELARREDKKLFSVAPNEKGIVLHPPQTSHIYRRLAVSQGGSVAYEFTQILHDQLTQAEVFHKTMQKPIQEFLSGTSQLIFTYGVTNSGKTYTLLGPKGNEGILPRALDRIFDALGENVSSKIRHQPDRYEDVMVLDEKGQTEAMVRHKEYIDHRTPKTVMASDSDASPEAISSQSSITERTDSGLSGSTDSHGFFDHRPVSPHDEDVRTDRECVDPNASYEIWVSFMEIYEDMAYDLLEKHASKSTRVTRSRTLKICDDENTCYAKGLIEVPVFSAAEAYHVMGIGRKNCHVAATKLNDTSSRSHCIFTIKVVKVIGRLAEVTQLSFCDLAGTERALRTDNVGARMKESQNINKDLHHLKECIEALKKSKSGGSGKPKREIIPYRNCKLTRLFRSFFSGKGVASLILNISQCYSDFDETVQAIRFGSSAMRIMIPMTKRESILIQAPRFGQNGNLCSSVNQQIMSIELEDPLDGELSLVEESDEDDTDSNDENDERQAPSTVKKRPLRPSDNNSSSSETIVKSRPTKFQTASTAKKPAAASAAKKTAGSTVKKAVAKPAVAETTIKKKLSRKAPPSPVPRETVILSTAGILSSSSSRSSSRSSEVRRSTSEDTDDVESECSEADLTLGGALREAYEISDEFWEASCPFPEHVQVTDQRARGLMLLLGSCQNEIKQQKAVAMADEMHVRKELCDFFDKERRLHEKQHKTAIAKLKEEFSADLHRQLLMQKDALERQYSYRGDPSLLSFESHETDLENEELKDENQELRREVAEWKAKYEKLKASHAG